MSWIVAIGSYIVIWWLTLFLVLPFGVQAHDDAGQGHASGAPVKARMKLKILIATGVATVLWIAFFLVNFFGLIGFAP